MSKEELKEKITSLLPTVTFDETAEWLNVNIASNEWLPFAEQLRNNTSLKFDYLFCITAVDWKTHLSLVYHLRSIPYQHIIVVKAKLENRAKPEIESVAHIWRTAEFHEREAYDLLGVKFLHHPDMRRLFLTDEWVGYPLRKDYEDPINMIKL